MPSRPSIELFVRSLAPTATDGPVQRTIDRLGTLDDRDVIEGYTVTVWGSEIHPGTPAARTDAGRHILDSVAAFEDWAADSGVRVDRFYETRTVDGELTGESYTATSLPVVAMAERRDGDLEYVTPHESGESVRTVHDRLEELASRTLERADPTPATARGSGD